MHRNRHKSTQQELPSPEQHLREVLEDYPGLVDSVNYFLKGKGKDLPDWPQWCLLPMAGWYAILFEHHSDPMTIGGNPASVSAIGTWMFTRSIYRFDPDLVDALVDTPLTDALPCDALFTLPEWCAYIDNRLFSIVL